MKTKVGAQNFYVIKKVDSDVVNWGNGRKKFEFDSKYNRQNMLVIPLESFLSKPKRFAAINGITDDIQFASDAPRLIDGREDYVRDYRIASLKVLSTPEKYTKRVSFHKKLQKVCEDHIDNMVLVHMNQKMVEQLEKEHGLAIDAEDRNNVYYICEVTEEEN